MHVCDLRMTYDNDPSNESICFLQVNISIKHRRLIHDLVLCFKIVHGLSALQFTDFFKFSNTSFTRGHNLRLAFPLTKCSTRRNLPTESSNHGTLSRHL